ncbi:MAG: hypothetical protein QUS08_00805 [Methanothrix sp.]|nr:hypothetical protein [Methanothrix sp.]
MTKAKKKSKGPQHRNSNYQMKNGNAPLAAGDRKRGLMEGISSSISSATSSIVRMLKH